MTGFGRPDEPHTPQKHLPDLHILLAKLNFGLFHAVLSVNGAQGHLAQSPLMQHWPLLVTELKGSLLSSQPTWTALRMAGACLKMVGGKAGHCPIACSQALDGAALTPHGQCRGQRFPQLQPMFIWLFLRNKPEFESSKKQENQSEFCGLLRSRCRASLPSVVAVIRSASTPLCLHSVVSPSVCVIHNKQHHSSGVCHSALQRGKSSQASKEQQLEIKLTYIHKNTPTQSQHTSQFFLTASLLTQLDAKCLLSSDRVDWFGGTAVGNCPHRNYRN